jgi:L-fucose isomerase
MSKHPRIGIRPTIDGRQGGVRESLEEKTMKLAQAVANLISANVKYADGTPVECVIADGTIGRVAESAACAAKFERENVGATISVTSCWCYGSETMDMHPHWPKAVWGFNGTERPGAVYLAAVLAGHAQKGLPAFGIYGHDVQDLDDNTIPADVAERPPERAPIKPYCSTASLTPLAKLYPNPVSGTVAPAPANSTIGS